MRDLGCEYSSKGKKFINKLKVIYVRAYLREERRRAMLRKDMS